MSGDIREREVPCTRGLEPELRRARLVAARSYTPHSAPRTAILLGHWDGGSIVGAAKRGSR